MSIQRIGRSGGVVSGYRFKKLLEPGAVFEVRGNVSNDYTLYGNLTDRTGTAAVLTIGADSPAFNILLRSYYTDIGKESSSSAYSWKKQFQISGGGLWYRDEGGVTSGPAACNEQTEESISGTDKKIYDIQPDNSMVIVSATANHVTTGPGSSDWCFGKANVSMYVHFPGRAAAEFTYRNYQDLTVNLVREY